MEKELLSIGEASRYLGVSIDILRNWDKKGILLPFRASEKGHRYYHRTELDNFINGHDIVRAGNNWVQSIAPKVPANNHYCQTRDVFQARLDRMLLELERAFGIELAAPLQAISGEIGNNSFDHNLGNWPDISGIFFSYDLKKKVIVLGDRGQGIRKTLKRVRPEILDDVEAVRIGFTEIVSGRSPESRGNGLKFVRKIIAGNNFGLSFQSGNALAIVDNQTHEFKITPVKNSIQGCFAVISFSHDYPSS